MWRSAEGRDQEGFVTRPLVLFRISVIISLLLAEAGSLPDCRFSPRFCCPRETLWSVFGKHFNSPVFVELLLCANTD